MSNKPESTAAARTEAAARLAIGIAMAIGLASCGSPGGGDGIKRTEAETILTGLGVRVDNPPDASLSTTQGTTVVVDPDAWKPTKTREVVLMPRDEVMAFGPSVGSGRASSFEDGYSMGYAYSAPWASDSSWANGKNLACAGDFDGDGIEEALILSYAASTGWQLRIYDGGALSQVVPISDIPPSYAAYVSTSTAWWDGDAYMIGCQVEQDDPMEFGVSLGNAAWLFDVSSSGGTWSVSRIDTATYSTSIFGFAAGDCDGDGLDELCVVIGNQSSAAQYALFDSRLSSGQLLAFTSLSGLYAYCAFGDPDGDRIEELVMGQLDNIVSVLTGPTETVMILNWGGSSFTQIYGPTRSVKGESTGGFIPLCLDMNGDGRDEIFCMQDVLARSPTSGAWSSVHTDAWDACKIMAPFQAADVDGDGKEDLVFSYGDGSYTCVAYSLNAAGSALALKHTYYSGASSSCVPAVVALNADDDSPRVSYDHHSLKYSPPLVIAVMASSPYYSTIASSGATPYDMHEWTTSFGTYTSSTTGSSTAVGFSVGGGVKGETSAKLFGYAIAKVEYEFTANESFTWEWDSSSTIETSIDYIAAGSQDTVLFTAVPVDDYAYEIVSSPEASEVGGYLHVYIPRGYSTGMVSLDYFNANNGDLDDIVLPHALGDPWSYPDSDELSAITAAAAAAGLTYYTNSNTASASRATGSTGSVSNLEIAVSSSGSSSFRWDNTESLEVAAGTEAVQAVVQLGFSTGYTTYEEWTNGTRFGGTVGYLPNTYYTTDYFYDAKLFAYQALDSLQNRFWIVEYSVN